MPIGAAVTVDGHPIGKSDGLFVLAPGVHRITIELDGYASEMRDVEVHEGRITRLELDLQARDQAVSARATNGEAAAGTALGNARPEPPSSSEAARQSSGASDAASTFVSQGTFPASTRQAMLTVLRQHPGETRWSGRDGDVLFGVAVKPLPQGDSRTRSIPVMLELVQMQAVHEVLKAKSLLDRYAAEGLTDATTLRQAVEAAAGELQVTGKAKGLVHQAAVRSGFAVG